MMLKTNELLWLLYTLLLAKEAYTVGLYTDEQYKDILRTHVNAQRGVLTLHGIDPGP